MFQAIQDWMEGIAKRLDAIEAKFDNAAGAAEPEDDLAGGDEPDEPVKKVVLADVQDAVRAAVAIDKEKAKKALAKFKAARATELKESDYEAAIAELKKVKK